jgi:crotonobetainyl-CoA:carnitine CoA-transferase CaiB-like acyl-CoA transferase
MKYNRMADVLADEHLKDVGFFEEREGEHMGRYRSMKHPVHYSATPAGTHSDPPISDQDGDEIREALGFPRKG